MTLVTLPIAAYAANYALGGEAAFVPNLAASFRERPTAILLHTAGGALVLLAGLLQMNRTVRARWPAFHR